MEAQRFQLLSDEDLERLYDKSHNKKHSKRYEYIGE